MTWFPATTALPLLALLAALRLQCALGAAADDYTAFVYAGCSQARYAPGTEYAADVDTALSSLTDSAGSTPYAKYTSPSTTQLAALYQCRSDLPAAVCGACAKAAVSKLSSLCSSAAGGAVQLRACFVRYGNDSFLGKQDTTVLFKKCGRDDAGAGAAAASLGTALGALQAGSGSFRAGAAGDVQAMAQCVGDLGDKACSECVAAAASQLKAGCGGASAGEAYLGKCYARFWSGSNAAPGADNGGGIGSGVAGGDGGGTVIGGGGNGVGVVGGAGGAVPGNGYPYGFVPRTTYGDVSDGSGKTIAIIIGLVAAVAIVIIFLSFVRRARNLDGKS